MYVFTVTLAVLVGFVAADVRDLGNGLTWEKQIEKGMIFVKIGSNGQAEYYGRGGYRQDIFNDNRGKLTAEGYGSRVISPNGDSSNFGGRMDFANDNAKASVDVSKQIGAGTNVQASGSRVWKIGKNTEASAGGTISQQLGHGRPDIGVQAEISSKF